MTSTAGTTVPTRAVPPRTAGPGWRALVSGAATPQRLRRIGALLVLGCLVTALVSALIGSTRANALGADGARLAALDFDASQLYRSLNEASALATSGFGAEARRAPTLLAAYNSDVAGAGLRLVHAAGLLEPTGQEGEDASLAQRIAYDLPRYSTTVDEARALRDAGSPRAQAALDGAAELMRTSILPASDTLQQNRRAALSANYALARGFPVLPVLLAAVVGVGIVAVSVRERRRTNRIINVGLVAAGALVAATLVWWLVATFLATTELSTAGTADDVATALGKARVTVLQARADETVTVAAGVPAGPGALPDGLSDRFGQLLAPGGLLDTAAAVPGSPSSTATAVNEVRSAVVGWQDAVRVAGAGSDTSRVTFVRLTAALASAVGAEQGERSAAVERAGSALTGIAVGPAVLMALAAVAAAAGIGVRVREYRA